jgi:hypothetical protein
MNQNIFCSKCHRIPSQCVCGNTQVDDWAWKVIRSCGLSTGNSDINVIALHKDIREMLKPRELTDEEINEVFKSIYGHNNSYINSSLFKFARAILQKASEK